METTHIQTKFRSYAAQVLEAYQFEGKTEFTYRRSDADLTIPDWHYLVKKLRESRFATDIDEHAECVSFKIIPEKLERYFKTH